MKKSAKSQTDTEQKLGEIIAEAISKNEYDVSIFSQFAQGNDLVVNFVAPVSANDPGAKL